MPPLSIAIAAWLPGCVRPGYCYRLAPERSVTAATGGDRGVDGWRLSALVLGLL